MLPSDTVGPSALRTALSADRGVRLSASLSFRAGAGLAVDGVRWNSRNRAGNRNRAGERDDPRAQSNPPDTDSPIRLRHLDPPRTSSNPSRIGHG